MEGYTLTLLLQETNQFYVVTQPKVASSWISDFMITHKEMNPLPIRDDYYLPSTCFNQITLDIHKKDKNVYTQYLESDWKSILSGGDSSKDFVFFLRNPFNRFVSVIIKDVLLVDEDTSSSKFLDLFEDYPNKEYLTRFLQIDSKSKNNNHYSWTLPNEFWDESVGNVVGYWVKKTLSKFFKGVFNLESVTKIDNLNNLYLHRTSNLYFYHKILFNSNINSKNIKFLDIDRENIYDYFSNTYNLQIEKRYNTKINDVSPQFKSIVLDYLKRYHSIIESILKEDVLMYIDIYEKIYSKKLSYNEVYKSIL